jgi:tetratricopeptide (TPR) repeat protein
MNSQTLKKFFFLIKMITMRKSIFTALFALAAFAMHAQTVEDVYKALDKKNMDKAKESVDKLTADPNSKSADAWFAKAQVYNNLAVDDKYKTAVPDAYEQAFEAFRKAYEIDPNNKRMLLELYKSGFVAYEGVANKAAASYQANNLDVAFDSYKRALDYGAWLNSKNLSYNGYSVPKLDTGMIFMTGYIAMKQDKKDDAAIYFSRLANAKVNSEPDYVIPYQFLTYTAKSKKDEENFKKYDALGRQLYPKDPYFVTINLDHARENNNFPELFNAYDQLIVLQPDSLNNNISYASEMFGYLYKSSDTRPADFDAVAGRIETNLKRTLDANYETLNSNLILAQLYYNQGVDMATEADKIRSTKPEDIKKKNEWKTKAISKYDQAIPYSEKVAAELEAKTTVLKLSEKAMMKNMYIMLEEMYNMKGNKPKAEEYNKKYSAIK